MRLLALALAATFMLSACNTVTMVPNGNVKRSSSPTFQARQDYFLFGLIGDNRIDVQQVCAGKPVSQMQSQHTFVDMVLTIITLGIYAPRSAKVWCQS